MRLLLRYLALPAFAFTSLSACQRAADEAQPTGTGILGAWQLTVAGGGITGRMDPVPADQQTLVFGPDSAYARYEQGKLVESSTFRLRTQPSPTGGPDEQRLIIKTYNAPGGQAFYYPYYVIALTADELKLTTGGGCAWNSEYVRTKSPGLPAATR